MKLALRLVVVALIGIVAIGDGILRVRRECRIFRDDMRQDAVFLRHARRPVIVDAWATGGETRARQFISDINREDSPVRIRWVWFDADPGTPDVPTLAKASELLARQSSAVGLESVDQSRAFLYFLIATPDSRPGALEISESFARLHADTHGTVTGVVIVTAITVLVSALSVTLAGVGLVGPPLRRVISHTRKIGAGDFAAVLDIHPHDELGELNAKRSTARSAADIICQPRAATREAEILRSGARTQAA